VTTPAGLRIEPATEKDVSLIHELIKGLADLERLGHLVAATHDDLREALFGVRPVAEAVVASVNGRPAGYALWFYTYSTFLGKRGIYLEDLFVAPGSRGRGIGRALLTHLARVAIARGCERIEWAVLNWNEPAIRFYEGLGAEPINDWTIYRLSGDALRAVAEVRRNDRVPGESGTDRPSD
jgi:GNAT superfamily N-acetyltransferase